MRHSHHIVIGRCRPLCGRAPLGVVPKQCRGRALAFTWCAPTLRTNRPHGWPSEDALAHRQQCVVDVCVCVCARGWECIAALSLRSPSPRPPPMTDAISCLATLPLQIGWARQGARLCSEGALFRPWRWLPLLKVGSNLRFAAASRQQVCVCVRSYMLTFGCERHTRAPRHCSVGGKGVGCVTAGGPDGALRKLRTDLAQQASRRASLPEEPRALPRSDDLPLGRAHASVRSRSM